MEETPKMDSTDKQLEDQLLEAGNKLVDPPSSVDEILLLLNQVESCLSKVEQSPSKSMQDALSPSLKALIADKLLRHSDANVKVAVASCISEITRITAPDAPYDDDQMKDVFRLIVSSFENLHDESSLSYKKRTSILETVAKVRSCVVMLDLECDALILEMFQHFLKTIREHHQESVFSSIETIMVLVLEESEDISLELLSPILASLKKDNEEVLPIARKLGETVLKSCATKLKPYLLQAVNTLGISLDAYNNVVASICQDISGNLEQNDACATSDHVIDKCKSEQEPVVESALVANEIANDATPQHDDLGGEISPKSVMCNSIAQAREDEALVESKFPKKEDNNDASVLSKANNLSGNEENNDLDTENVDNKEQKLKQGTERRGKKSSSFKLIVRSNLVNEKEAEEKNDSESHCKEVPSSPNEDGVAEAAGPSENGNDVNTKISSPKASDNEPDALISLPPGENSHDEIRPKGCVRTKKKNSSVKQAAADVLKKVSEGTCGSEVKPAKASVKKGLGNCSDAKITTVVDVVKNENGKTEERNKGGGGSSSMQLDDKKKKGQGKGNSEKGLAKSCTKDEDEEMPLPKTASKSTKDENLEETPKINLKRKRTPGKEKESGITKYDGILIGKRVKVWWPDDEMFYEGVIESFDSSTKKHKVSYIDGDVEILNLKKEKFEVIEDDADPNLEEGIHQTSPDATADMPPKKKGKTNTGVSKKEGKKDHSSKSGGATSSKSKSASVKSSHKSKPVGKSEDEIGRKSKEQSLKSGGKSIDAAQKSKSKNNDNSNTRKSKDDDISTPRPSAKSKQETPKTGKSKQEKSKIASSSKTKSSKRAKSNTNGSGKVKSSVLKIKDSESENSDDSEEEVEETKVKTSKAGSEVKSGKKEVEEPKGKTSSKAGNEVKSGKKEVEETKGKTTSKAGSEVKSGKKEVEETKVKTSSKAGKKEVEETKVKTSPKAGSEVKSGKKRGRN